MRKIKECLRLHREGGLSQSQVAKALAMSRSTVQSHLRKFDQSGLRWEEVTSLTEAELDAKLFKTHRPFASKIQPDWAEVHQEMGRRGVTLRLLWEEYRQVQKDALGYTQFCRRYRDFTRTLKVYMRQVHKGGEKVFADYSGLRPTLVDYETGEVKPVELFIMAWGASHYLYAEAQESQSLQNWIMGHVRAFEFFGCVPHIVVPDNLKAAVTKACIYDPEVNPSYNDLATHYGFAVLPARPYRPKDKAKVEVGVQIIQRFIIARLRHRIFHTLLQLNTAIGELLSSLNGRLMKPYGKSRLDLFQEMDLPMAKPLSKERFLFHQWQKAKVGVDYCVEVLKHYYSVPYIHAGKDVDIRLSEKAVEIFLQGERLVVHRRSENAYGHSVLSEHMPERHRKHLSWTPHRILSYAQKTGPSTLKLVEELMRRKPHPEMAFRPALGILRLSESFGPQRLEAAAEIALQGGLFRVRQISDLLKRGLDQKGKTGENPRTVQTEKNIRGAQYFQERMVM